MRSFVLINQTGTKALTLVTADHMTDEDVRKLKRVVDRKHDLRVLEVPMTLLSCKLEDTLSAIEKVLEGTTSSEGKPS